MREPADRSGSGAAMGRAGVLAGVLAAAVAGGTGPAAAIRSDADSVACTAGDARYVLAREPSSGGAVWVLRHRERPGGAEVRLVLPDARPAIAGDRARLDYRSGNGGIIIHLAVAPASSSLDVYVSYELEVNVDPSLTPEIDRLNTGGPRAAACRVSGAP